MNVKPNIWAVIVTYQAEPWIHDLLTSIESSTTPVSVVVVDNASSDSTLAIIRHSFPDVDLLAQNENHGFGVGNNIGISHALGRGADYVYLVNQDAIVPEDSVEKILDVMERHSNIGVASPLHISKEGQLDRKTFVGFTREYAYEFLSDAATNRPIKDYYEVRGVNAAAWFFRRRTLERVGGFDPMYFMYWEDIDMINRLAYHQECFALVPNSRFIHLRQSVTAPKQNWKTRYKKARALARAEMLTRLKEPSVSASHSISILISRGFLAPLADFSNDLNLLGLAARISGTLRVAFLDMVKIAKARDICRTEGAHFLTRGEMAGSGVDSNRRIHKDTDGTMHQP